MMASVIYEPPNSSMNVLHEVWLAVADAMSYHGPFAGEHSLSASSYITEAISCSAAIAACNSYSVEKLRGASRTS
jgi:hypothetical protein